MFKKVIGCCLLTIASLSLMVSSIDAGRAKYPYNSGGFNVTTANSWAETHAGNVFFVDSGHASASDNSSSGMKRKPFATLDYAIGRCTASNDDLIVLLAGHAENITAADAIDADVAGITILGVGNGSNMPTITHTVAAGEVTIGAANVTIENVRFNASVTATLKGINVEDGVHYTTIKNCVFGVDAETTDEFNATIYFENDNTGAVIEGNVIDMGIAGAVAGVHADADTDRLTIRNNVIRGDYSTANIVGDTTLSTNILIENNLLENGIGGNLNAQPVIELLTATTGTIRNNEMVCNVASPNDAVVADTCLYFDNSYSETINGNSTDAPLAGQSYVQVAVKNQALDDTDDLFDVNTGSVIVYALYATCEVDGDQSPVVSLLLDADDAVNVVLATGIDIAAVNTDDTITITGGAIAINNAGADTAIMLPMVMKAGVIESVLDSGTSGAAVLKWHCVWAPLDSGATVTDAT